MTTRGHNKQHAVPAPVARPHGLFPGVRNPSLRPTARGCISAGRAEAKPGGTAAAVPKAK